MKPEMKTYLMKKIRLYIERRLPNLNLQDADLIIYEDLLTRELCISLEAKIAAGVIGEQEAIVKHRFNAVFRSPRSWWQHFKLECFPKWLQRRFPVLYHTEIREEVSTQRVKYQHHVGLPEFRTIIGDHQPMLHYFERTM